MLCKAKPGIHRPRCCENLSYGHKTKTYLLSFIRHKFYAIIVHNTCFQNNFAASSQERSSCTGTRPHQYTKQIYVTAPTRNITLPMEGIVFKHTASEAPWNCATCHANYYSGAVRRRGKYSINARWCVDSTDTKHVFRIFRVAWEWKVIEGGRAQATQSYNHTVNSCYRHCNLAWMRPRKLQQPSVSWLRK